MPGEEPATRGGVAPEMGDGLLAGETLGGYLIEHEVARGGMGIVYRARDEPLGRTIALKVIAPALAADRVFRERFRRESRLAAQVEHPAVVPVYRAGQDKGRLYIAMRFVEGTDLATVLRDGGALTPQRTIALVGQVAGALDAAHARGLVHRDVKPANVLLSGDRALLTDFGLTVDVQSSEGLTRTGTWVGTLAYAAPEQLRGGAVDARTDVYALGGVLHHCLTGQLPYPVDAELDAIAAHISDPPPRPSAVDPRLPNALDKVVGRAMSKDPGARFPSAGDLAEAAAAALRGEPPPKSEQSVATGAAAPRPAAAPTRPARRTVRAAAAAVVVAALGAAAIVLTTRGDDRGAARSPQLPDRPIAVGLEPDYLTVLGGKVWTLTQAVGRLARVDPRTRRVDQFPPAVDLGGGTYHGLAAGAATVWIAHGTQDGGVDGVDPRTGAGVLHIPLRDVRAVAFGGGSVWAVSRTRGEGTLVRIDPGTERQAGRRIDAGRDPVAVEFGGGSVWVVNRAPGTLTRIDPVGGRVRAIRVGPRPSAVAAGDGAVWVLNAGDDTLVHVDPASGRPVGSPVSLGKQLDDVELAGGWLWVAAADSTVSRLDPATGRASAAPAAVGRHPLALARDGDAVWVASAADHTVQRLAPPRH